MNEKNCKGEFEKCVSLPILVREAPANYGACDIRHSIVGGRQPKDMPTRQPRSGERMQPTAQAVGELMNETLPAPEGRKKNVPHIRQHLLHFIFSTQVRRPLIKPDFRVDLFAYLGGIVREMDGTALIVNGTADHVHMLARLRPVHSAAEVVRIIKANSSRWVHEKWDREFAMADWIWRIQRERIECRSGEEIYCRAGRASSEAFVSGGVRCVPQEKQCGLR